MCSLVYHVRFSCDIIVGIYVHVIHVIYVSISVGKLIWCLLLSKPTFFIYNVQDNMIFHIFHYAGERFFLNAALLK